MPAITRRRGRGLSLACRPRLYYLPSSAIPRARRLVEESGAGRGPGARDLLLQQVTDEYSGKDGGQRGLEYGFHGLSLPSARSSCCTCATTIHVSVVLLIDTGTVGSNPWWRIPRATPLQAAAARSSHGLH